MSDFIKNNEVLSNIINYFTENIFIVCFGVFIFLILSMVCYYKIFKKANQKGYKSLIPFYNVLVMFKIAGLSMWNILFYIIPMIFSAFVIYLILKVSSLMTILLIIPIFCIVFITFRLYIKLAHKFNMSTVYGIFLLIIPINIILLLILAFSKKIAYSENKIQSNIVSNKVNDEIIEVKNTNKVCPKCNKKLTDNAIYCTFCEQYIE